MPITVKKRLKNRQITHNKLCRCPSRTPGSLPVQRPDCVDIIVVPGGGENNWIRQQIASTRKNGRQDRYVQRPLQSRVVPPRKEEWTTWRGGLHQVRPRCGELDERLINPQRNKAWWPVVFTVQNATAPTPQKRQFYKMNDNKYVDFEFYIEWVVNIF